MLQPNIRPVNIINSTDNISLEAAMWVLNQSVILFELTPV